MVVHVQLNAQLRVAREQTGQDRRNQVHGGKVRAGHPQGARREIFFRLAFNFLRDLRERPRFLQHLFACRGQRQLARGAVYQPRARPFLHLFKVAAHHWAGNTQRPGRRAQTSQLAYSVVNLSGNHAIHINSICSIYETKHVLFQEFWQMRISVQ